MKVFECKLVFSRAATRRDSLIITDISDDFSDPIGGNLVDGEQRSFEISFGPGVFDLMSLTPIEKYVVNDLIFSSGTCEVDKIIAPLALKEKIERKTSRLPRPVPIEWV